MKSAPEKFAHTAARLVRRFRGRRIGVVGDLMLDRYLWGTATRLSPEAAVPVVDFVEESECLGGAGNVAANLAALGARVLPFGVVGEDDAASALRRCLARLGLPANGLVVDAARTTTVKTRIIARHQQVVRVDREKRAPLEKEIEDRLIRRVLVSLPRLGALILSDYDKGVVTDALSERVLSACHRLGLPAFVKPKTSRLFSYRGAAAIVCNVREAGFFVSRAIEKDDDEAIDQAGRALLAHFGCSAVVITLGEKGMSVWEDAGSLPGRKAAKRVTERFHIPATSFEVTYARLGLPGLDRGSSGRQVFDVTGAGDTVLATLALAVAAGASLREAAVLANTAAGVVVGKLGTASVSPGELIAAVRELAGRI
jgi:D-beta-D-heptose 7-phosphate kinase/D-beta-D-heptose 1-phosphate adenosyltransferase